jgi:hypothetical protein
VDTVRRIANEVAGAHAPLLRVVGIVLASSGSQYVEVIMRIDGCRQEPCQFALGAIRNVSVEEFRSHVEEQLRAQLAAHP